MHLGPKQVSHLRAAAQSATGSGRPVAAEANPCEYSLWFSFFAPDLSMKFAPLFALLALAFATLALPAHADCDPKKNCPYGPGIAERWEKGQKLEAKGDYAGAIKEYEQALAASKKLTRKDLDKKQVDTLRACAANGSTARLEGAKAGLAALAKDKTAKKYAAERVEQVFRITTEEFDRKQPELASACP